MAELELDPYDDLGLDPRWEWVELPYLGSQPSDWVRGECRHTELEPVADVAGERVATLCRTCGTAWKVPARLS
jgi:hypothetical protein